MNQDDLLIALTLGDPTTIAVTPTEPDDDFLEHVAGNGWTMYRGSLGPATFYYIVKDTAHFEATWQRQIPDQPLPFRL